MADDEAYAPYCSTCGGEIHRWRGEWVHMKMEAAAVRVQSVIKEFDLDGREAKLLRAIAAFFSVTHMAEPVWTSADQEAG